MDGKQLAETAPIPGESLDQNAIGFVHVLSEGLMSNAPLASTIIAMTAAASYALGALPLAYLVGIVVVALWINTPLQFSTRLASASGVAYFAERGAGALMGYLAGLSYFTYYVAIVPTNALFFGVMVSALLPLLGVAHPASWLWVPLYFIMLVPSSVLAYIGVRTSLNYGAVAAVIEIVLLLAIGVAIIASPHTHGTFAVYNFHLASGGLGGFAIGMLTAAFGMSGSTTTVYLGSEARAPHSTIRKALIWATLLVVVLYVIISYAFTVAWGPSHMSSFASSAIPPGFVLLHRYFGVAPELIVAVFVVNSLVSANMADNIVTTRIAMTFGRARLFPHQLGRIHPKYRTPSTAVVWVGVVGAVLGLVAAIIWGPVEAFIVVTFLAVMGEFLGHILGNLALPFYFWKKHALRWFVHVALPILSLITIILGVFTTFFPITIPFIYPALFSLLILVVGTVHFLIVTRRDEWRLKVIEEAFNSIGSETEVVGS